MAMLRFTKAGLPKSEAARVARRMPSAATITLAEGKGFEPLVNSRPQRFSRPPHSAALATFR